MFCQYCHQELPDDSKYCICCGKSTGMQSKKMINDSANVLIFKESKEQNFYGKLGFFLFLFALIILDSLLGSIVQTFGDNYKVVFYISLFIYGVSMSLGALSFYTGYKYNKGGYFKTANAKFALLSIVMSFYIALLNVTQVIIK